MKTGIFNTSTGGAERFRPYFDLFSTHSAGYDHFNLEAVREAVESGKIGGLAIDVIEGEAAVRGKKKFDDVPLPSLKALLAHKNVIFTNHSAFYTDEAYRNLSKTAVDNLLSYARTGTCEFELTGL